MDYSRHLVLYSGGADSTYFIQKEESARYLLHFAGLNTEKTKVAVANATALNRYLTVLKDGSGGSKDGEANAIHALYDAEMVLRASVIAASFGLSGVVACFNRDDIGVDADSIRKIMQRAEKKFDIALPLKNTSAAKVRASIRESGLPYVSCMVSAHCGSCPKCKRGY